MSASVPLDDTQRVGLDRLNDFLASGGGVLRVARIGGVGVGHVLVIFPLHGTGAVGRPSDWVEEHVLDDQVDPRGAADELRARKSSLMTDLLVVVGQRRKGIGRVLVQDAIEVARASGAAELSLYVAKDNVPARRLYEELGFAPARDAIGQIRYSLPLTSLNSTTSGA